MASSGMVQALDYGVGGTPNTYAGLVTAGRMYNESGAIWRPATGGKHAQGFNMAAIGGSATIMPANVTLLTYFTRASFTDPTLTALSFKGFCLGDVDNAITQTGSVINNLNVDLAVGDALSASIDWLSLTHSAAATSAFTTTPTAGAPHWEWFRGECTFNGGAYKLQRLGFQASNNVTPYSSLDNKSDNSLRLPEGFIVGNQTVRVTAEVASWPGTTMFNQSADGGVTGIGAVLQCSDGTNTITFTLANLTGQSTAMGFVNPDGMVVFALELDGEPNASNTLAMTYS